MFWGGGGALMKRRTPPRRAPPRWRCVPTRPSGLTARLLELLLALPGAAREAPRTEQLVVVIFAAIYVLIDLHYRLFFRQIIALDRLVLIPRARRIESSRLLFIMYLFQESHMLHLAIIDIRTI